MTLEWSPDGRHLLVATTAPRLRVDNGYQMYKCASCSNTCNDLPHFSTEQRLTAALVLTWDATRLILAELPGMHTA